MEQQPLARRVFSLSGVVPLGFFLLEHTWLSASVLWGQRTYLAKLDALYHTPLVGALEVALVFLPLVYHACYGLWMMRSGIPEGAPPHGKRSLSILNRGAAVVALGFIVWHAFEYRVPELRGMLSHESFYTLLVWRLSTTWHGFPAYAMLYMFGILATTVHFALGSWGWAVTTGLLVTAQQKTRGAWAAIALGSAVVLVAASSVVSLATGAELSSAPPSADCQPKP